MVFMLNGKPPPIEPIGLSIHEAINASSLTRSRLFDLMKTGEIDARKVGKRTVIIGDSLRSYLLRNPSVASQAA